jgi:4-hydroxysphinganine ceramide fatty acyl 2-hydroxylase
MTAESTILETIPLFLMGCLWISFAEYCMHRFLFHAEHSWLPDHPKAIAVHFIANGIHHAFP